MSQTRIALDRAGKTIVASAISIANLGASIIDVPVSVGIDAQTVVRSGIHRAATKVAEVTAS